MQRPKITAVNHYNVFPFNHGGKLGIRGLYKALSEWFDINIVTIDADNGLIKHEVPISNHIMVYSLPLPVDVLSLQQQMFQKYGMKRSTVLDPSLAVVRYYHRSEPLLSEIRDIAFDSDIVIAEHVYTWNLVKAACPDKHLWYRANNVEYDFKKSTWEKIGTPEDLLQEVFATESDCVMHAERTLTVSEEERQRFISLYQIPVDLQKNIVDIRSGYDIESSEPVFPAQRKAIQDQFLYHAFFIASDTPYTFEAARHCVQIAKSIPELQIIIAGTVCKNFFASTLPANVKVCGVITDDKKDYYLRHCDFALNLMQAGAGINVKMFEYFAYGIPVITTEHGARGIDLCSGENCIITNSDREVEDIQDFLSMSIRDRSKLAENAFVLLQEKYSWRSLGMSIKNMIQAMYSLNADEYQAGLNDIALFHPEVQPDYFPEKNFYIRGAGDFGRRCFQEMNVHGLCPIAFVDNSPQKIGTKIFDVPVISEQQYLKDRNICKTEIVVAAMDAVDFVRNLLSNGVPAEEISIAWNGTNIVNLMTGRGSMPYYLSFKAVQKSAGIC